MPNRLERSVSANAGMESAAAAATAASMRTTLSVTEYSECRRRWTKAGGLQGLEGEAGGDATGETMRVFYAANRQFSAHVAAGVTSFRNKLFRSPSLPRRDLSVGRSRQSPVPCA